jgi:hypothetical protein
MDYGLIPLGSDAWLAKGKMPRGGVYYWYILRNEKKGTGILLQFINLSINQA